jgi:thioredoxin-related protein
MPFMTSLTQKFILTLLISLFVTNTFAQKNNGIAFQSGLSWQQVKAAAQANNQYIFVDVYATWCGPCKAMDKNVYPSAILGKITKDRFLCVKVQSDKTVSDDQTIKSWYKDAEELVKTYQVSALPSLLFYSPDGKFINKAEGYQDEEKLAKLLNEALVTKSGFDQSVDAYRAGKLSYPEIKKLALDEWEMHQYKLADSIANTYKNGYLYQLTDHDLFVKEHVSFIRLFPGVITSTKDRFFNFFYKEPEKADQMTTPGYAHSIVQSVIAKEEVDEQLFVHNQPVTKHPDWIKLNSNIKEKYGDVYARELTALSAQIAFYRKINDWSQYTQTINEAIKKYPPKVDGHEFANATMVGNFFQRDDWNLNSAAWDMFEHCNDRKSLKIALRWSNLSIAITSSEGGVNATEEYYDTKANLLYRIGQVKLAIDMEEKAYEMARDASKKSGRKGGGEGYLETIKKMKSGVRTWANSK